MGTVMLPVSRQIQPAHSTMPLCPKLARLFLLLCCSVATATEITFQQDEVLGQDWPRKLLHYPVSFDAGVARADGFQLTDDAGSPVPVQVGPRSTHADGSFKDATGPLLWGLGCR
jgi:hypothetical protein